MFIGSVTFQLFPNWITEITALSVSSLSDKEVALLSSVSPLFLTIHPIVLSRSPPWIITSHLCRQFSLCLRSRFPLRLCRNTSLFISSSSPVSPPMPPTIPVECDSSGLEPTEQEGVSEVRRLSGGKVVQVRPRPGPDVLHPLLRHLLHDRLPQEVQVQPLLPHQGDRSICVWF